MWDLTWPCVMLVLMLWSELSPLLPPAVWRGLVWRSSGASLRSFTACLHLVGSRCAGPWLSGRGSRGIQLLYHIQSEVPELGIVCKQNRRNFNLKNRTSHWFIWVRLMRERRVSSLHSTLRPLVVADSTCQIRLTAARFPLSRGAAVAHCRDIMTWSYGRTREEQLFIDAETKRYKLCLWDDIYSLFNFAALYFNSFPFTGVTWKHCDIQNLKT